jgi:hypothetical protein
LLKAGLLTERPSQHSTGPLAQVGTGLGRMVGRIVGRMVGRMVGRSCGLGEGRGRGAGAGAGAGTARQMGVAAARNTKVTSCLRGDMIGLDLREVS